MDESNGGPVEGNVPEATADESKFQSPTFEQVEQGAKSVGDSGAIEAIGENLDGVLDVPVTLSVEVGCAEMSVGELLRLAQGSVVELDRSASDPLDILVNGTLIARGEIVMINENFGVRLIEVIAASA